MKAITPFRLGVFGGICCVGGLAWFLVWFHSAKQLIQFNIDVVAPFAPRLLAIFGFWLVVASLIWAAIVGIRRRRSRVREGRF
jgi:hypothetical protein